MYLQATPSSVNVPSQAVPSRKQQQPQQPHLQHHQPQAPYSPQQQQQQQPFNSPQQQQRQPPHSPQHRQPQAPNSPQQKQQPPQTQPQTTLALASLGDGLFGGRSALAGPRVVAVPAAAPSRLRAASVSGILEAAARASTPAGGADRNLTPTADGISFVTSVAATTSGAVAAAANGAAAASPSGCVARSVGASPLRGTVLSVELLPAAPPSTSAASSLSEMLAATGSPTLARFAPQSRLGNPNRVSSPGVRITAGGGGGAAGVILGQLTPLVVTAPPPPPDTPLPARPQTPVGALAANSGDAVDVMLGSPAAVSGGRDGAPSSSPPSPSVLSLYAGRAGGRSTWSGYGGMPSAWPGAPHVPPWLDLEVRGAAGPMAAEQALESMAAAALAAGGVNGGGAGGSKGRQVSGAGEPFAMPCAIGSLIDADVPSRVCFAGGGTGAFQAFSHVAVRAYFMRAGLPPRQQPAGQLRGAPCTVGTLS